MKKTYISPAIHIMAVQMQQHMLIGSKVYDDFADTESAALVRGSGDWDIWGDNSDDYDDEY